MDKIKRKQTLKNLLYEYDLAYLYRDYMSLSKLEDVIHRELTQKIGYAIIRQDASSQIRYEDIRIQLRKGGFNV